MAGRGRRPIMRATAAASQEKSFQMTLQQARTSGVLNLANRELHAIPSIFYCEDSASGDGSFDSSSPRWWETVDIRKVFIQCNKLTQIPPELMTRLASSLAVIDASDNALKELSIVIGDLSELQSLNLSHNKLSNLPDTFVNLARLADLNISHNDLTSLPTKWSNLTTLISLNLSHNKLTALPDSFGLCSSLSSIDLSNNLLTTLPSSFSRLQKLQSLDLSFNKLAVTSDFSSLANLKVLKLDNNSLKSLPDISKCRQLKELSICDNALTAFDVKDLECLRSISILNLRGNKISELSEEFANALQQIERLDLANNDLSTVPPQLGLIDSLKSIVLDGNPLRALRRDVVSRGTVFIKQWLVSRLPESVLASKGQQSGLSVGSNDDSNKTGSKSGEKLDLSNRGSENFTSLLTQSNPGAKELVLSKNKLSTLDGAIFSQFRLICFLDVSCNMLRSLPDEICSLSGLRQLNISSNKFSGALPSVVYDLKNLEVLIASDNSFDSVDTKLLVLMGQLSVLDIRNNNFAQLAPEIANCPALKHLEVTGNPFKMPRPEIVRKGSLAILEYLRTKIVA